MPLFNLEFGYTMSFGQMNVNRHDKTRGLQCAYMTKISFLHSSFSHQKNIPQVYEILRKGSETAREEAAKTLAQVRKAMKIDYFDDAELIAEHTARYKA